MRRPHVRINLKVMMVAVAVLALACCPIAYLERRRADFRGLAAFRASRAAGYRIAPNHFHLTVFDKDGNLVDHYRARKVFWHSVLRDQYERAALRPWEPVEPDNLDLVAAGVVDSPRQHQGLE